jgi:hypothetical protein
MDREQALTAQLEFEREDYAHTRKMLDDLRDRLMAAIVDVIDESGHGSPQHIRLRYALSGEGKGAPSARAIAAVANRNRQAGDAPKKVTIPGLGEFDLDKLNQAIDAVVEHETEEAGRYALMHTHGWPAPEAVIYARAAQCCCDSSIDPRELVTET